MNKLYCIKSFDLLIMSVWVKNVKEQGLAMNKNHGFEGIELISQLEMDHFLSMYSKLWECWKHHQSTLAVFQGQCNITKIELDHVTHEYMPSKIEQKELHIKKQKSHIL